MKTKKRIAYCIQKPNGGLLIYTTRTLKRVAILALINNYFSDDYVWSDFEKRGYKCVKIEIKLHRA